MITFRSQCPPSDSRMNVSQKLKILQAKLLESKTEIKLLRFAQNQIQNFIKNTVMRLIENLIECQYHQKSIKIRNLGKQNNENAINLLSKEVNKLNNSILDIKQNSGCSLNLKNKNQRLRTSILKQLQEIKNLENKENKLRKTNQKHISNRKSITKESFSINITPKMHKIVNKIKIVDNSQEKLDESLSSYQSLIEKRILFHQSQQKIKQENQTHRKQLNNMYKQSEIEKNGSSIPLKMPTYAKLRCSNNHEYYAGMIFKTVPHGEGALINCCNKIPLKISQKIVSYTGKFYNGYFEGIGTINYQGGLTFIGQFKKGKRHGEGGLYFQGKSELGIWENDKPIKFI